VVADFRRFAGGLEFSPDVGRVQGTAGPRGENKVVIAQLPPHSEPFLRLSLFVGSKRVNRHFGETQRPARFLRLKNTRVVGPQPADGVTTTEYAGSFTATAALKWVSAASGKLWPRSHMRWPTAPSICEWIDGQHHLRKMTEIEAVNGDTVTITINVTAINHPVRITAATRRPDLHPGEQQPGSGTSGSSGLARRSFPPQLGSRPTEVLSAGR
jgi:hypothetical protein